MTRYVVASGRLTLSRRALRSIRQTSTLVTAGKIKAGRGRELVKAEVAR